MSDVQRSATGYQGFWIALGGSVSLVFWWILFTFWFCNKTADVDFNGGTQAAGSVNDTASQRLNQNSDDEESRSIDVGI